ncbi:MAG TPA: dephospho-CoA kinase [Fimbriimonadaceae bacterium]|nr:dephospho-CoA kinase [Fimbriimonadaceae bacterium]
MRIAVTGGIAEGKSTVMDILSKQGFKIASADAIAREIVNSDSIQIEIARILNIDGIPNKEDMRNRISGDHGFRRKLNRLVHPRVLQEMRRSTAQIIEVPLLFEACLQGEFDRIWVVTCGREEQLRRLSQRLANFESAERLVATQLPTEVKLPFADEIIRTNQPMSSVVNHVHQTITRELEN